MVESLNNSYSVDRFEYPKLGAVVDFMRKEPFFSLENGLKEKNADQKANEILWNLSDLRFVNCIEQCVHGCIYCLENAGPRPSYILFEDFQYELSVLKKLKNISGLNFSYKLFDVTTHQDGDTMMYFGYETSERKGYPSRSSYDILRAFREAEIFDSEIPGRQRFQLFTTGWFDYGSSRVISSGAENIVKDADFIFGEDPKTKEKGRMVFSFGTWPKYFQKGEHQISWWKDKLVEMFRTIKSLYEKDYLQFSIKYLNYYNLGNTDLDLYSAENQIDLLCNILKRAEYKNIDSIINNESLLRVRPAYKAGRGKNIDLPLQPAQDYITAYYPSEYSLVRQNTNAENTLSVNGILKTRPVKTSQYINDNEKEYESQELYRFWLPSYGK